MTDQLGKAHKSFEEIKKVEDKLEFWSARDLMVALGYKKWSKFEGVIGKAKIACESSGHEASDHFAQAGKMVQLGSGSERELDDYLLTRYACYLIAQNGDSRKREIALAQTYFALQTRKQELDEQRRNEDKRLEARAKHKETETKIGRTVYERGIKQSVEFASFKNKHIKALYGGLDARKIKEQRGIPANRALADFDTHVELKAKEFALAMTDHNIKKKNIYGRDHLEGEVVANSKATRKTLLERGIRPEDLEAEEDLKKIEGRRKKEKKLTVGKAVKKIK